MPTARGGIAAATVPTNGELFIFGGEAPEKTFDNTEIYNPSTDTWTSGPAMPTARHGLAAADIGDKVYVIGGGPEPDISFANVVEILNVGSNSVNTGTGGTPS
jgi:N-acetylneuraminic acid mutarotase